MPEAFNDGPTGHTSGSADVLPPGVPAPPVTYEVARAELEEVVRRLEAGGGSLEESLILWERGEGLAKTCQALLDGARARLAAATPLS